MKESNLTPAQLMRSNLIDRFPDVNTAREVYDFIMGEEPAAPKPDYPDGVYLVDEDGRAVPYGSGEGDPARHVGVVLKVGDIAFRIGDKDQKDVTLINREDDGSTGTPFYVEDWALARMRTAGKTDTERIREIGTDIQLAPDEYIPSLHELYLMFIWIHLINGALEFIGHEPLAESWYWSSTEYSATYAWYLYFNYGGQSYNTKASDRLRVRPVSAFRF